jgi:MoxR-like ATPase
VGTYPFQLVDHNNTEGVDRSLLRQRPFVYVNNSLEDDARRFVPGDQLEVAINTAIAVGEPLLITGEPGTGKTQTAYYVAYKLGVEPVIHFQVKSDSRAQDLLYYFDTVRYFHDAHFSPGKLPDKGAYVERRALWEAMESPHPRVLLIDEIDKAPRDFPNDLLHELERMDFTVVQTNERIHEDKEKRPIVIITSNGERQLPDAFLRRCVYHHIRFDAAILEKAVESRRDEYGPVNPGLIKTAMKRFMALRSLNLHKRPSTAEFIIWLRVLVMATNSTAQDFEHALSQDLSKLPFLGVLLKNSQDIEQLSKSDF